ncbi:hypothetical protein V8C35DRAFT_316652, partial [Trichoderma chlorosporum]
MQFHVPPAQAPSAHQCMYMNVSTSATGSPSIRKHQNKPSWTIYVRFFFLFLTPNSPLGVIMHASAPRRRSFFLGILALFFTHACSLAVGFLFFSFSLCPLPSLHQGH